MKNIENEKHDPVRHPAHYEIYPVQPITISRHLGFCLGNVLKYTMRAPWKGGVEDCEKALQYLKFEQETPQGRVEADAMPTVRAECDRLVRYMYDQPGDNLWNDIATAQRYFLTSILAYVLNIGNRPSFYRCHMEGMEEAVERLKYILSVRYTATKYAGTTGRPLATREAE